MWGREMPSYLALKDDEGMHIRAALSGEILGRVPCRDTTLKEIRELASKGMKWSVPDYCLDLVGQGGAASEERHRLCMGRRSICRRGRGAPQGCLRGVFRATALLLRGATRQGLRVRRRGQETMHLVFMGQ